MSRFLVLLAIFCLPAYGYSQFTGSGTFGDPYSGGTLTGGSTWATGSSPIYVAGDLTIGTPALSGHLTIEPGVTIVFLGNAIDIRITGLGQITADGTASNRIRFTADHDNDGNYGESGERWGHISFQSMGAAGASLFDNCIIEYGDVSSTSLTPNNPERYGGAIHADFSNLTISNCELRYNSAGWGGGIFVGFGKNPTISNCHIHNNVATVAGGGLYLWTDSYSTISNSIISYNSSTGTGGGGGLFIGGQAKDVRIINSLITNNSSASQSTGHNIRFNNNTNNPKPKLINSIVWLPSNSIVYLSGGTASSTDFEYCAILTPPIAYNNTMSISSVNNATTGPNFVATDGSNYSTTFFSPLRDAGVNTFTGVTIPANDITGNPTVFTKDIGPYEYQYSRWKTDAGSTDWATASNWEASLVPGSTSDIVIPAGASLYPTGSSPVNVTVGAGKYFIMEAGSRATVNNLTNGGILRLLANSTAFSSLIATSYARSGIGTEEIQVFLSGGGNIDDDNFKWHYISSPVASLPTNIFTGTTLDLAQFVESRPTISLRQGWVAFDGYIYSTGGMGGPTFNNLTTATNGKGYNYFHLSDLTYTFSGLLNTTSVTAPLGFSNNGGLSGYNLLGNPFLSGLDWNYIINDPGFPLNTTKGLYFTRDNVMCSYISGVGVPGDVTGIIPPMQGFFSKTYTTGNSIIIPVEARTHDNIHPRYKGSGTIIPLVRLALTGTDITDEAVVRFDEAAKSTLDNDFDAEKFFILETKTYIYTILGAVKYTINGLPFPETTLEIPVVANVISDGSHTINASQLQGLDNYRVTLVDQQENITTDLRVNPLYSFTASKGKIENRFVLIISELISSSENIDANSGDFKIFTHNGFISVTLENDLWDGKSGTINLVDLTGRTLRQVNGIEFRTGSPVLVASPEQKGVYLVQIRSGIQRFTGKVLVK